MVFDFRLPTTRAVRGDAASWATRAACSRSTARTRSCSTPPSPRRSQRGDTAPRYHATTRPPYVEAVATAPGAGLRARWRTRRSTSSTSRRRRRSTRSGARKAAGRAGLRRDLPALPDPDRRALRRARPEVAAPLRHLAAAPLRGRPRRAVGRPRRRLARPRRHRPRRRPASPSRRPRPRTASVRPDQQRRAGHRDAPDDRSTARASRRAGSPSSGMVDLLATTPARRFGLARRARSRSVATPTSCSSIPAPRARSAPPTSTTRATTRRTRASRSRAPSARRLRPRPRSSATAPSSGARGVRAASSSASSSGIGQPSVGRA